MWPDLKEQIAVEESQLERLLAIHQPLLERSRSQAPNDIELSALAALLHSFYTGIENLFRRIAIEIDGGIDKGEGWHRRLLVQMGISRDSRPSVVSGELLERLHSYLQFRHVFRSSYSFQLHWEKMQPLVLHCEETFDSLRAEIASFISQMDSRHEG
ncbi:MAG TPA: hypothetical protein VIJ26_14800 [Thermoanaerobaculia bacterium]